MTHKIVSVEPLENLTLLVTFQNGIEKTYDVRHLYSVLPQFQIFETDTSLFHQVQVEAGGHGISWNDELDLDAEEIWESGLDTGVRKEISIQAAVAENLIAARARVGMTQKQLADATGIYQADISKIERGLANPSLATLKRLADGLGLKLTIDFEAP